MPEHPLDVVDHDRGFLKNEGRVGCDGLSIVLPAHAVGLEVTYQALGVTRNRGKIELAKKPRIGRGRAEIDPGHCLCEPGNGTGTVTTYTYSRAVDRSVRFGGSAEGIETLEYAEAELSVEGSGSR
jgi:hypothetical protein